MAAGGVGRLGSVVVDAAPAPGVAPPPVLVWLPFAGLWLVQNSPARRVPSHGTDLLGERYAVDFVGVDARHRTAHARDWRSVLATEPVDRFFSFGRPVLAPVDGVVVRLHDGETDHEARRSQLALVPYALGQRERLRQGMAAVAGNHLVVELAQGGVFVALAHLRSGSLRVRVGDRVVVGEQVADCGNSGNSTQPHVHLQVMDGPDASVARGLPVAFRRFREWPRGAGQHPRVRQAAVPAEGAVVEPVPLGR